jgi:prepilin peptidase CpaA
MDWQGLLIAHWPVYLVSITMIVAAWIDGTELRVPNAITFPMVLSGLVYCTVKGAFGGGLSGAFAGLGWSLLGVVVGLLTLLPLYAVGGMGGGDVKLMAGVGAWLGVTITFYCFIATVFLGAFMSVVMVYRQKAFEKHTLNFLVILSEWISIRNPSTLAELATERKPNMLLLPYGVPMTIGSIAYFFYGGLMY